MTALSSVDIPDAADTDVKDTVKDAGDLTCQHPGCGRPLFYGGRGRKPKFCDEHRVSTSSARTTPKRGASSPAAVEAAVNNLDSLYSLMATGLMMFGLRGAASELAASQSRLQQSNREFLSRDPELVKMLNKGGAATGRVGFIVTNALTLGPVMMIAAGEWKSRHE